MRLLPILWAEPPTADDWARLSAARIAIGYTDPIQPVKALPGSPGPILAIGQLPSWLTGYAHVESTADRIGLEAALQHCLGQDATPRTEEYEALLSHWMGVKVTCRGEEEYDGGVRFS